MTTSASLSPSTATSSDTVRRCFLAGTMALAPVLLIASAILSPRDPDLEGVAHLDAIAPERGSLYLAQVLAACGLVLLAVAAHGVILLVRQRGGALVTAGWILTLIGGTAAGAGMWLYGAVMYLVTDPSLDRQAMGALDTVGSNSLIVGTTFGIGFVSLAAGLLLLAAGLARARTVPLWMPVLLGLGALLIFAPTSDDRLLWALTLSPLLVLIGLAVEVVRLGRGSALPRVPDDASSLSSGDRYQSH